MIDDHLVSGTLGRWRIRVTVHTLELIALSCPLTGRTLLCKSLIAAAEGRWSTIVAIAHHLEVDLGVTSQMTAAKILGLILNDHLLKEIVLFVHVLLNNGLLCGRVGTTACVPFHV